MSQEGPAEFSSVLTERRRSEERRKKVRASRRRQKAMIAFLIIAVVSLIIAMVIGYFEYREKSEQIGHLSQKVDSLIQVAPVATSGMATVESVEKLVREQLRDQGGISVRLLRAIRPSFVEMYSYDNKGGSSYGTACHLGNGYFLTVKHGVVPLEPVNEGQLVRVIHTVRLNVHGKSIAAKIVDFGSAKAEVDPGDWAILKSIDPVDLPVPAMDLDYSFEWGSPFARVGNDYSKGIVVATGFMGQRTGNDLFTALADGHPGVSGGGVVSAEGKLIGIPVGRMQGDYRFSFILPLRQEMFRKVPHLADQ